jgi:ComF family protein
LAALMQERGAQVLSGADVVVPVPLHPSRRRARGFNQADDLCRHLGLPVLHAVCRVRMTATQADLPAHERQANVRGAFSHRSGCVVTGLTVVVVDDVSTTGATLEACGLALKEAGAGEVRALTAARVVEQRR